MLALALACLSSGFRERNIWDGWTESSGLRHPAYRERIHWQGMFRTRANTWSNLAYILVGGYALALGWRDWRHPRPSAGGYGHVERTPALSLLFGLSCCYLGFGSGFFHASLTRSGQQLDVAAMYSTLVALIAFNLGRWQPRIKTGRWTGGVPSWPFLCGLAVLADWLLYQYKWSLSSQLVLPTLVGAGGRSFGRGGPAPVARQAGGGLADAGGRLASGGLALHQAGGLRTLYRARCLGSRPCPVAPLHQLLAGLRLSLLPFGNARGRAATPTLCERFFQARCRQSFGGRLWTTGFQHSFRAPERWPAARGPRETQVRGRRFRNGGFVVPGAVVERVLLWVPPRHHDYPGLFRRRPLGQRPVDTGLRFFRFLRRPCAGPNPEQPGVQAASRVVSGYSRWRVPGSGAWEDVQVIGFDPDSGIRTDWGIRHTNLPALVHAQGQVLVDLKDLSKLGVSRVGQWGAEADGLGVQPAGWTKYHHLFNVSCLMVTDVDNARAYLHLPNNALHYLAIKCRPGTDPQGVAAGLQRALPDNAVHTTRSFYELTQRYWQERTGIASMLYVSMALSMVVGFMTVFLTLFLLTSQKLPVFAAMKVLGASTAEIGCCWQFNWWWCSRRRR